MAKMVNFYVFFFTTIKIIPGNLPSKPIQPGMLVQIHQSRSFSEPSHPSSENIFLEEVPSNLLEKWLALKSKDMSLITGSSRILLYSLRQVT